MTNQEFELIQKIKNDLARRYPYLNEYERQTCFDMALGDYLRLKYPSDNNRPSPEELVFSFSVTSWIYARMLDICGRSGVPMGVKRYSENNLSFEFASGNIDESLVSQIMPRAGVPR